ncbi:MAG: hypothetical protein IIT46_11865 [Lachnospiraceae bacterium]|nr:hypothetical protein [Lachnospiraceae bacterium]
METKTTLSVETLKVLDTSDEFTTIAANIASISTDMYDLIMNINSGNAGKTIWKKAGQDEAVKTISTMYETDMAKINELIQNRAGRLETSAVNYDVKSDEAATTTTAGLNGAVITD